MESFPCPYLKANVELTDERESHIARNHPDLLPEYRTQLIETLATPDQIRRSARCEVSRLFSRWYDSIRNGKHIVVVVVSDYKNRRHWIISAYLARKLTTGEIEWKRS